MNELLSSLPSLLRCNTDQRLLSFHIQMQILAVMLLRNCIETICHVIFKSNLPFVICTAFNCSPYTICLRLALLLFKKVKVFSRLELFSPLTNDTAGIHPASSSVSSCLYGRRNGTASCTSGKFPQVCRYMCFCFFFCAWVSNFFLVEWTILLASTTSEYHRISSEQDYLFNHLYQILMMRQKRTAINVRHELSFHITKDIRVVISGTGEQIVPLVRAVEKLLTTIVFSSPERSLLKAIVTG